MTLLFDNREPDPHPWIPYLPEGWRVEWGTMETGDLALARLPDGVVIERKSPSDFAGCIGGSRDRFERELRRSRHLGRFLVIVEGSLADVATAGRSMHHAAILGTVAAWSTRYCPIIFAGSVPAAAALAFSALRSQVRDIQRNAKAIAE
jgi:ERCC4-type nuclease